MPFAAFAVLVALSPAPLVCAQSAGGASLAGGADNAVSNMQGALLADPASREQVLSLQDDPQMQAILNDPATMRAIQSGDLGALMKRPQAACAAREPDRARARPAAVPLRHRSRPFAPHGARRA